MTDTRNKKCWSTTRAGMLKEHNQRVPEPFQRLLLRLYADNSPQLNPTLAAAHRAGWKYAALGRALYIGGRSVRDRVRRAQPDAQAQPVPEPPRHQRVTPALRPLTSGEVDELRKLKDSADPQLLTARLAALRHDRVTFTALAETIGVTRATIRRRIARLDGN